MKYILMNKNTEVLVQNIFKYTNDDGNIENVIYIDDNEYVIKNITRDTIIRLKKNEIKKIYFKKIILIRTIYGQYEIFPRIEELEELFLKN